MKNLHRELRELRELDHTLRPRLALASRLTVVASAVLVGVLVTLGDWTPAHSARPQMQIQLQIEAGQTEPTQPTEPQATCPPGGQCFQDVPPANAFYEFINRLYQQDIISGYACGQMPNELCVPPFNRPYYRPANSVNRQQMSKFVDQARRQPGIYIDTAVDPQPLYSRTTATNGHAIVGIATNGPLSWGVYGAGIDAGVFGDTPGTTGSGVLGTGPSTGVLGRALETDGVGVLGVADFGYEAAGVKGISDLAYGVYGVGGAVGVRGVGNTGVVGQSGSGTGVSGVSDSGRGVSGISSSFTGVYGQSTSGWAGYFVGNIYVSGNCTGCAGPTKVDHPLDPENKYLYHSPVESPDMMNVYNGNVTLDAKGEAVVELPDYFEALNRDFRYQLTTIGGFAPVYIAEEVNANRFKIAGGKSSMKVSWQVMGVRHDPYAEAHRVAVEEEKPAEERGKYLHPTEWGQPESKGVDYENQQKMEQEQTNQDR